MSYHGHTRLCQKAVMSSYVLRNMNLPPWPPRIGHGLFGRQLSPYTCLSDNVLHI